MMMTGNQNQQASVLPHTGQALLRVVGLEGELRAARAVLAACRRRDEEQERESLGAAYVAGLSGEDDPDERELAMLGEGCPNG